MLPPLARAYCFRDHVVTTTENDTQVIRINFSHYTGTNIAKGNGTFYGSPHLLLGHDLSPTDGHGADSNYAF